MEASVIERHSHLHFPLSYDCNSHFHSLSSHSPSFLFREGLNSPEFQISDIEMITFQSVTYTSLKDLISSPATVSSSSTQNSSWIEIPIKNPLVKQAAMAYLLPMAKPPEIGDKDFLAKVREYGLGCLGWFCDVVMNTAKDVFGGISDDGKENGEEEDEVEKEEEKVALTHRVRERKR